ncbi:hypothetical protein JKY72_06135 [Candidatus Gracilibacteria bacterium]|nr:hypothetical protein [Candidatus Gracilibacteria bacterium]
MAKKKTVAKKIGTGLAKLQSLFDDLLDSGFRKLKKEGKKKVKKDDSPKGKVKKGLRKTAGFLGEMGESFYDEYEKIKAKKVNKK